MPKTHQIRVNIVICISLDGFHPRRRQRVEIHNLRCNQSNPSALSPPPDDEMNEFLREHESFSRTGVHDVRLRVPSKTLNGDFHFVRFESSKTREAIEFIASTVLILDGE
ncbi:hypothetical protein PHYPSEUDO_004568 [Phytophthora pseudosyringae]|uniref:Uncharacterized protein n=1 Tax=Phytophthora pseudosyringae TaxID=221518 RepID=A0A8T1WG01_9STRA|nr:hypothetical protein PHYPSEUDO_004568 [Phytophthora pseudosyringae]